MFIFCVHRRISHTANTYKTALKNLWSFQSDSDAVEENENQNHIVKDLMSNNGLAKQPEPDRRETKGNKQIKEWQNNIPILIFQEAVFFKSEKMLNFPRVMYYFDTFFFWQTQTS